MPHTPQPFLLRPFKPDRDLLPLVRLLTDVENADHDGEDTTESAQRAWMNGPNHDPAHDRWVIQSPDNADDLIGYGAIYTPTSERAAIYVAVHPDWRRRGLGSALLERVLNRARESGRGHASVYANEHNTAAHAFLRYHHYQVVSDSWQLQAAPGNSLAEVVWPPGYVMRTYAEVQQVSIWIEVTTRSYGDLWGHGENTAGTVTEELIARRLSGWNQDSMFLVFAPDGQVAGFCQVFLNAEHVAENTGGATDYLNGPGVVPEHRSRGLYRPLILTAMHWQRAHSPRGITLELYGETEQTVAIYQAVGFTLLQHFVAYRLDMY
jgi:mycothiol synthase